MKRARQTTEADKTSFESTTHERPSAPDPTQADWPRRQHVGPRADGPGQREHDRDMSRSYGSDTDVSD